MNFPAQWVDASKFEAALSDSGGPHGSTAFAATFHFPTNCKVMVDAAIRLLSLANQLASTTRHVQLDFEEGEGGTHGVPKTAWASLTTSPPKLKSFPLVHSTSAAKIYRGGNAALVEIAKINTQGA